MTHACEAVKTRHKETSLIFPVLALVVLFALGKQPVTTSGYWHQYPCTYWYFKQRI